MDGRSPPATEAMSWPWLGALAGILTGLGDWLLFHVLGVDMLVGGRAVNHWVFLFFGVSYAVLGYLGGHLIDARRRIRQQYEALQVSQARTLQLEKLASIGRLAAGVAHEVRNPLAVIRSSTSLLLESLDEEDPSAETAGRFIEEEIDRLDAFIGALLDFSRPVEPSRVEVEVSRIAEHVGRLAEGAIEVEVGSGVVAVDRDQIVQLLFALVVNAREVAERVRLRAFAAADGACFEVEDDGPGIAAEDAGRIFEPFFTTKGAQGTGLGLPMAARIAEAHEAQLELVEGELGGACFRLTIPDLNRRRGSHPKEAA